MDRARIAHPSASGLRYNEFMSPSPEPPKPRWYHNVWLVLVMLFFVLGPLGLPLLWKSPHFARWAKIALTILTLVYTCWLTLLTIVAVRAALDHYNQLQLTF